jgi:hypothetical protein
MRTNLPPSDAGGTPEGALHTTLRTLATDFGVDVSPAAGLQGAELAAWVDQAEEALLRDQQDGMIWWNGLPEVERTHWMRQAGDTGRVADAWAWFKRWQGGAAYRAWSAGPTRGTRS